MPSVQKQQQLLSVLESLPEDSQQKVLDYAESLAERKERGPESARKPLIALAGCLKDAERSRDRTVSVKEMNRVIREQKNEENAG